MTFDLTTRTPPRPTIDLGFGSRALIESDGGLSLFLDHRDPESTATPKWQVSHAMTPEETERLRVWLCGIKGGES